METTTIETEMKKSSGFLGSIVFEVVIKLIPSEIMVSEGEKTTGYFLGTEEKELIGTRRKRKV